MSMFRLALLNFFLAALLGALLRYAFVEELAFMAYRPVMHGHSHGAMLGWVYLALYALLLPAFVPAAAGKPFYQGLFWVTQLSVAGMLVSFPLEGYGPWSISFSTLHVLCAYAFAGKIGRDLGPWRAAAPLSHRFLRAALRLMLLSTLGLWALGPLMASGNPGAWYYMAIQFFLHFQFNGWFIFAVIALALRQAEAAGWPLDAGWGQRFFWLLLASALLTFALALTWAAPSSLLFYVNGLGGLLQLGALYAAWRLWRPAFGAFRQLSPRTRWLWGVAAVAFALKVLIQGAVLLPFVAEAAYTIRNYVIGFFHLILLGVVTHGLLAYAYQQGILPARSRALALGIGLFSGGFILSEGILFVQGTMFWGTWGFLPAYYEGIFAVSALMPLGLLLMLVSRPSPMSGIT